MARIQVVEVSKSQPSTCLRRQGLVTDENTLLSLNPDRSRNQISTCIAHAEVNKAGKAYISQRSEVSESDFSLGR